MHIRILVVTLLFILSPAMFATEDKTQQATALPDQAESQAMEYQGVVVVDTNRQSQPLFNVLDIIVSYNGTTVEDTAHLKSLLKEQTQDTSYQVGIIRDKENLILEVNKGPWFVDLHDMTQETYSTLITDQNSQSLSKHERKRQLGMLQQYLKGRPYRTPNNQGSERNQKPERYSDGKQKDKPKEQKSPD